MIEYEDEVGIPETALREIGLLKMLNSSGHSVRLLDVEHGRNYVHIVMDYVDTNLKIHIGAKPVDPCKIRTLLYQLCEGVAYFHSLGVIHRDLKPANLLIEENEGNVTLKIADFGLSSVFSLPDTPYTDEIVTLWYRAPEVLLGSVRFTGVDIWAVGCIFAEMSSGQPLFPGGSEIQQLGRIFSLLGTPTEEEWPEVTNRLRVWGNEYPRCKPLNLTSAVPLLGPNGVDLLSKMLKYNPAERISAKAALNHCYFAENNTSIEVLSKEDTCGNFEIAYKLLVNMSLESPSYEQVLKQPKFAETRERAFEKIESISNDQLFDSFTCSTAMYYIDILLSKFDLSDLEEPGFVNLWATVCYRTALKVVNKSHISFPELELFCSAPHDWNHLEIVLAKALNWNLCPATLHTLFYYLKEYLQLKFAYNKIGQHIPDDDSVVGSAGSASSGDSCLYDHTTRNADNDEMKVKSFVDSLILRVLSDTQFLQFQACDIAAALGFLLCDIPRSYTVIAVNHLTNKEKVKECEALLRTCFFSDE